MNRCSLLVVVLLAIARLADASYGLDAALMQAMKLDPVAVNDTYESLRPRLRDSLENPRHSLDDRRHSILSFQSTTLVTVRLVGFSSNDRHQLEQQLSRYLEVLNKDDHVHLIGTGGTDNHRLNVRSKIEVEVVRAGNALAESIFNAIQGHLDKPFSLSTVYHQPVPYNLVDNIVRADLEMPLASYVIYVLNLKHQKRSYGYDYQPQGDDALSAFTKCLGNMWMGRERYLWVDLAAGPIEYGPALSGEGLIQRNDIYPYAAAFHGESPAQKALLADLASLLWSASQMLLAPAIRVPVRYEQEIQVHLYHIHSSGLEDRSDKSIKWDEIEGSFMKETDGLLLQGQSLLFRRFTIDLDSCPLCSALLARSTKSYTSRVLLERYSLFVNDYVDSRHLHYLLEENQREMESMSGVKKRMARVVPVYIFDLETERVLLLDRYEQAVAFRDMVIGIRTRGYQTMSEFNCNGRPVVVQTRDMERPIVGALLQTLWGVTPTHLTWSSQHNSTFVDYTWSLGHTPFGPFSSLSSLSFAQKDAAPRNVLHTMLNTTVWGAVEVLERIRELGGERVLLRQRERKELNRRWNFLVYKLNKATSAISHFDFDAALFFIRSSDYDLYEIHDTVYKASLQLEASMECFKDPPLPLLFLPMALLPFPLVFYVLRKREQLFKSKSKRF